MRRLVTALSLAFTFAGTAACSTDSTGPSGSVNGNYSLQTLNGSPLPVYVGNTQLTSERRTLNSDGTYTDVAYYSNGNYFTEYGYFTQYNNSITFDDQTDRTSYEGSISGNVLTTFSPGYTAVYRRD
jgi:hypothetical protein